MKSAPVQEEGRSEGENEAVGLNSDVKYLLELSYRIFMAARAAAWVQLFTIYLRGD